MTTTDAILKSFLGHASEDVDRIDAEYATLLEGVRGQLYPHPTDFQRLLDLTRRRDVAVARYQAGATIAYMLKCGPETWAEERVATESNLPVDIE